jgi:hypothetical protein
LPSLFSHLVYILTFVKKKIVVLKNLVRHSIKLKEIHIEHGAISARS